MWEIFKQDLGVIKAKNTILVKFKIPEGMKITHVALSCDCSTYKIDKDTQELVITYVPKTVPKHILKIRNYYHSAKNATVTSIVGGKTRVDVLVFSATVKNK